MTRKLTAATALAAAMTAALLGCTGGPAQTTPKTATPAKTTATTATPVTMAGARHCPVTIGHPVPSPFGLSRRGSALTASRGALGRRPARFTVARGRGNQAQQR